MANNLILVDTSILIDYYRKTDKNNSVWITLVRQGYRFAILSITKYEIYAGATQSQLLFWDRVLHTIDILPFDTTCVDTAVQINAALKRKRTQIALADLFIAATAVTHSLPVATLNRKHFDRIDNLSIIE
jgi:predicted nucleic acid-binding protein